MRLSEDNNEGTCRPNPKLQSWGVRLKEENEGTYRPNPKLQIWGVRLREEYNPQTLSPQANLGQPLSSF